MSVEDYIDLRVKYSPKGHQLELKRKGQRHEHLEKNCNMASNSSQTHSPIHKPKLISLEVTTPRGSLESHHQTLQIQNMISTQFKEPKIQEIICKTLKEIEEINSSCVPSITSKSSTWIHLNGEIDLTSSQGSCTKNDIIGTRPNSDHGELLIDDGVNQSSLSLLKGLTSTNKSMVVDEEDNFSNDTKAKATPCNEPKRIEEDKQGKVTSKDKDEQMRQLFFKAMSSKRSGQLMDIVEGVERTLCLCKWWSEMARHAKMVTS